MGNCLRSNSSSSSALVWAGDDWGSLTEIYRNSNDYVNDEQVDVNNVGEEREMLLGGDHNSFREEVKIKMTKRELEELMADVHMQGLTMEQVIARLVVNNYINNNYDHQDNYGPNHHNYYYYSSDHHDDHHHHHHHHWKPALQSIPEVN